MTLLPSISADFFLASVAFLKAAALPPIGLLNWLLTTNSTDFTFTKEMAGFEATGLSHSSTIRLHKMSTINADLVTHIFGKIEGVKNIQTVQEKLKEFLFSNPVKTENID